MQERRKLQRQHTITQISRVPIGAEADDQWDEDKDEVDDDEDDGGKDEEDDGAKDEEDEEDEVRIIEKSERNSADANRKQKIGFKLDQKDIGTKVLEELTTKKLTVPKDILFQSKDDQVNSSVLFALHRVEGW